MARRLTSLLDLWRNQTPAQPITPNTAAAPTTLGDASQMVIAPKRDDAPNLAPEGNRVDRDNVATLYGNGYGLLARNASPLGKPTTANPLNGR
jgi:hypothetical protein